ncbi:MAG: hypothetical protein KAI79_06655 [Bacteroidales bacterium]|nr:hypothetical protein [Bacteroidales bacterium]
MAKDTSNFYMDDYELTAHLMREQDEFKEGKRKMASNELASKFLIVLEHILTKRNYFGYSFKDEFRSKSHELFTKHWHKFDPTRARLNYYQENQVLYYKTDVKELRGGFGWFSLFIKTACSDEIKRFKKNQEKTQRVMDEKNASLAGMEPSMYRE